MPVYECPKCGAIYTKVEAAMGIGYSAEGKLSEEKLSDKDKVRAIKERTALEQQNSAKTIRSTKKIVTKSQREIFQDSKIQMKLILGLVGSAILFIGVFMPIISVPVMGNINYFQNGKGDGTIIIVLSIISLILVLKKDFKKLWYTGLGCIAVMSFTFINFQIKISDAKDQIKSELSGNLFRGVADMAMQSVQLQWGWAILIIGVALIIASAIIKNDI